MTAWPIVDGKAVIPPGTQSVPGGAFYECYGLVSVEIPTSVTSIGISAFHACTDLVAVAVPTSVTSISRYAFADCSNLVSVEIPTSVDSIADYAFRECISLVSVEIPTSVTSIGEGAFSGCTSLVSVGMFSTSLDSIGDSSFFGCSSLVSVEIPISTRPQSPASGHPPSTRAPAWSRSRFPPRPPSANTPSTRADPDATRPRMSPALPSATGMRRVAQVALHATAAPLLRRPRPGGVQRLQCPRAWDVLQPRGPRLHLPGLHLRGARHCRRDRGHLRRPQERRDRLRPMQGEPALRPTARPRRRVSSSALSRTIKLQGSLGPPRIREQWTPAVAVWTTGTMFNKGSLAFTRSTMYLELSPHLAMAWCPDVNSTVRGKIEHASVLGYGVQSVSQGFICVLG